MISIQVYTVKLIGVILLPHLELHYSCLSYWVIVCFVLECSVCQGFSFAVLTSHNICSSWQQEQKSDESEGSRASRKRHVIKKKSNSSQSSMNNVCGISLFRWPFIASETSIISKNPIFVGYLIRFHWQDSISVTNEEEGECKPVNVNRTNAGFKVLQQSVLHMNL